MPTEQLARAAGWLRQADGLLITAGAGIGIDSGLPDFRGPGGFWAVYPALGRAGIAFESIANPAAFSRDPQLAWGFYGHRLNLYRRTEPHAGFQQLRELGRSLEHGAFVFTSNVDGQFQKAGFAAASVCEVHGSIHHLQCTAGCKERIWPADDWQPDVDEDACRLRGDLPSCPDCGALARPNILMFNDWAWCERRTAGQFARLQAWLASVERPLCIEIGAGTAIPTVRRFSETHAWRLIRLNPAAPQIADREHGIGLPLGAQAGIAALYALFTGA